MSDKVNDKKIAYCESLKNHHIREFKSVLEAVRKGDDITYKMSCNRLKVSFIPFRKYVICNYDFDPDEVDMDKIRNMIKERVFIKTFLNPYFPQLTFKALHELQSIYIYMKERKYSWSDMMHRRLLCEKFNTSTNELLKRLSRFSMIPSKLTW